MFSGQVAGVSFQRSEGLSRSHGERGELKHRRNYLLSRKTGPSQTPVAGLRVEGAGVKVGLMIQTLEAEIDEHGSVKLARPVHLDRSHRALVMIMPDEAASGAGECALLSEAALAEDWNNPEEDAAWNHLQPVR